MIKLLAIDPGIQTGYAVFSEENTLIDAGIVSPTYPDWHVGMLEVTMRVRRLAIRYEPEYIVIEEPSVMMGSAKAAASTAEGSTIKLAMSVGALLYALRLPTIKKVELVPVIRWKGNLSKKIVAERVEKIIGKHGYTSHAVDAIGIGLYWLGLMK